MATAQINTRIDEDAKASGDRILKAVGYTPTRAVRALWGFAARNAGDLGKVRNLLSQMEESSDAGRESAESRSHVDRLSRGPLIIEEALQSMHVAEYAPSDFTDKGLLEEALMEKYEIGRTQP